MIGAGVTAYSTLPYKIAMRHIMRGGSLRKEKTLRPTYIPSELDESTLSPYLSLSAPAMHPFVPMKNDLQGFNPIKTGRGFLPAGY
jgi:hypothetical protein